jgi:hypothetical protein
MSDLPDSDYDDYVLTDENMVPHDDPAHVCYRGCYAWEDPYLPDSCGDED